MINNDELVINILKDCKALLEGHFLLSSGRHSSRYCQCARLFEYPDKAEKVISIAAQKVKDVEFDMIIGPAIGGIIAAYELGRQLNKPAIFCERENGIMCLRRGFEIKEGQKVLICEDVVTTGKSSFETAEIIKSMGAHVAGIVCIADRSVSKIPYDIYSAVKLEIPVYTPEECPLCKKGIPYVKPGSRNIK